jgi:hypothetical protein
VPWLRGYRCEAGHLWSPEDVFMFCRCGEHGSTPRGCPTPDGG